MKKLIAYPSSALSDEEWMEQYNADRIAKFEAENKPDSFWSYAWCGVILIALFWTVFYFLPVFMGN